LLDYEITQLLDDLILVVLDLGVARSVPGVVWRKESGPAALETVNRG
jgi:hypothetical protein